MSVLIAYVILALFFVVVLVILYHVGKDVRDRNQRHKLYDYSAE